MHLKNFGKIAKSIVFLSVMVFMTQVASAACSSPVAQAGAMEYFTATNETKYCDGTNWLSTKYGGVVQTKYLKDVSNGALDSSPDFHVIGNYAYFVGTAGGNFQITVYNMSSPSNPTYVGKYTGAAGGATAVTTDGTYLYVLQNNTLRVFSVATPASPTEIGSFAHANLIGVKLFASGGYIYATASSRLVIVNITTPSSPTLASSTSMSSFGLGSTLTVSGSYVYITWSNKLLIVDVTNKAAPVVASETPITNLLMALGIVVNSNLVYLSNSGTSSYGLVVVDVTNKSSPSYLKQISAGSWPHGLVRNGNYLYTASGDGSLYSYDITDPANPWALQNARVMSTNAGVRIRDFKVSGNTLIGFNGSNGFFMTFDLTPQNMPKTPEKASKIEATPTGASFLSVSGSKAVMGDFSHKFWVFDISNPNSMTFLGQGGRKATVNNYSQGSLLDGDRYYQAGTNQSTVFVYNIANPANYFVEKEIYHNNLGQVAAISKYGDNLFAAGGSGLTIFDVSNLASTTLIGSATGTSLSSSSKIVVIGSEAYVLKYGSIYVYNISNLSAPALAHTYTASELNFSVTMVGYGSHLLVVTSSKFLTIDVSTPTSPTIVSDITLSTGSSIDVNGTYAYVGDSGGIKVFDLATISSPQLKMTLAATNIARLVSQGNTLYTIANSTTILGSVNITNPLAISHISTVQTIGDYESVVDAVINGSYGISVSSGRLVVTDISDLSNPTVVHRILSTDFNNARRMDQVGNYLYILYNGGMHIVNVTTPSSASIVGTINNANLNSSQDAKVSGNYAYVLSSTKLSVVDVTNKSAPAFVTSVTDAGFNGCKRLDVDGTYLYVVCDTTSKFFVISLASPSAPAIVGQVSTGGSFSSMTMSVFGNYVVVGDSYAKIFDVSNKTAPVLVKVFNGVYGCGGCSPVYAIKNGNLLYYSESGGITVWDMSNPLNPTAFGSRISSSTGIAAGRIAMSNTAMLWFTDDWIFTFSIESLSAPYKHSVMKSIGGVLKNIKGVQVVGSVAYTWTQNGVVAKWDLTDPENPTLAGYFASPIAIGLSVLAVSGNTIFANNGDREVLVFDATNINTTSLLSRVTTSNWQYFDSIQSLKVSGSKVAVTGTYNWFSVIDAANPSAPVVGTYTTSKIGVGISVIGNYAYTCNLSGNGVAVFDMTTPTAMATSVSHADLTGCQAVGAGSGKLIAQTSSNKAIILDISTPASPAYVSTLSDARLWDTKDIIIEGNKAILTRSSFGAVHLVDLTSPASPNINDVYNTPGTPTTGFTSLLDPYLYTPEYFNDRLQILKANLLLTQGACATAGAIEYLSANNVYAFCNGTNYIPMGPSPGAGGAGCSSPTGIAGTMEYDVGSNKFKYCDGSVWRSIQ